MSETMLRQWELLRSVPREPKRVTVTALMSRLEEAGFKVVKRTVQRDLTQLSAIFPLVSRTKQSTLEWSWSADSPAFDLPTMDGPTALTVRLIEELIPTLLPPTLVDELRPQFARARAVLAGNPGSGFGRWADAVRVVPGGMPLEAPHFDERAVRTVYEALLAGLRFTARYRSRGGDLPEGKVFEINPLGLVAQGRLLYLVCTLWDYGDVRQLALHRLAQVTPLEIPVSRPPAFDLDAYIQRGEFQYPIGPLTHLKLKFKREAAEHLEETPLSGDQRIEDIDENHVLVSATVADSQRLEWWLMALTPYVEVLAPSGLRARLANRIAGACSLYGSGVADGHHRHEHF